MSEVSIDNLTLGEKVRITYHMLRYAINRRHAPKLDMCIYEIMLDRVSKGEISVDDMLRDPMFAIGAPDGSVYYLPEGSTLSDASDLMRKLHNQEREEKVV